MSDEFDMLDALRGDKVPPAGSKAKAEALDAALAAYDAAQTEKSKGNAAGQRLRSIIPGKGFWSMNNLRIPVGIAAAGVLVAIIVLGAMLSRPSTTGRESTIPAAPTLLCSALAATMVIVPFGLTIASIVAAVLPLDVIRELLYFVGGPHDESVPVLGIFSLLLAGVFGTLAGVFVALTDELAGILRDVWPSLREDR